MATPPRLHWTSLWCFIIITSTAYSVFGVITEAPQLIEVQALGARVLRVRWTPVSSSPSIPVTGYRLNASTIVNESTTVEFVEEVGANLTTFIFYGLSPYEYRDTQGVTYSVSLLAFNIDGDGPLSNQDVILPPCPGDCDYQFYRNISGSSGDQDPHPCGACTCNFAFTGSTCSMPTFEPEDVSASTYVSNDSLYFNVTWEAPLIQLLDGRLIQSFRFTIFDTDTPNNTTVLSSDFNGYLESLVYYQTVPIVDSSTYQITVETITDVPGDTASSTLRLTVPAQPPGPVQQFMVASVTTTAVFLRWQAPLYKTSSVNFYRLEHRLSGSGSTSLGNLSIISTFVTLAGLTPGTMYELRMAAVSSIGAGPAVIIFAKTACPENTYGLESDPGCSPCPEFTETRSSMGSQFITDCLCSPGYEGPAGGPCLPCEVGKFSSTLDGNCIPCASLLSTNGTGASLCDVCRYSLRTDADEDTCYYFETTTAITVPSPGSSSITIDDDANLVMLVLQWTSFASVFSYDDTSTPLAAVTGYKVQCNDSRGLVTVGNTHVAEVEVEGSANNSFTFTSLLPLVEYNFTVSIRAGPFQSMFVEGRPSDTVSLITPATASTQNNLPRITDVTLSGNNRATIAFELTTSIKPLITSLTLIYGELNSEAMITQISLDDIQANGRGSVEARELDQANKVNYLFQLQTVIGLYTYDSNIVPLHPTTTELPTTPLPTTPSMGEGPTTPLPTTPSMGEGPTTSSPSVLPAPETVRIQSPATSRSVVVTWSKLNSASGYVVQYFDESGELVGVNSVVGASVIEAEITGLAPYTTYTIQVSGVNDQGDRGPPSESITVLTAEEASGPPADVQVMEIEATSQLNVSWKPPTQPNGVILNYTVTIELDNGFSNRYTVDADTLFLLVDLPNSNTYSVSVMAVNGAGVGLTGTPPRPVTTTVSEEEVTSQLPSWLIPAAAGGGGGLLVLLAVSCLICCCCCCACRRRKTGEATLVKENSYQFHSGEEMDRFYSGEGNHLTAKRWMRHHVHGKKFDMSASSLLPSELYSSDLIETNVNAMCGEQEMYAEVDEMQRMKQDTKYQQIRVPQPYLTVVNTETQEIIKDASPDDYGNEELYQEMEKIYFVDVEKTKSLEQYEADRSIIELKEEIGHGEFGRVMKAIAKGVVPGKLESIVAVKMLKEGSSDTIKKDFLGEAHMLAKFHHPNVLGLLKVVTKSEPILVVLPHMPNGDLRGYLRRQKRKNSSLNASLASGETEFGISQQLHIGEQIAAGMEYLAAKYFIHRDLAARNVLVGEENSVKISDFGLSRSLAKEDTYYHLTEAKKLPVKWMALESLLYRKFSTYSDVWSFGVVLWEIFSFGTTPYPGVKAMNICHHIQMGSRMESPDGCPQQMFEVMQRCWREVKEERPTFTELKMNLKATRLALRKKQRLSEQDGDEENYVNDNMDPNNDQ